MITRLLSNKDTTIYESYYLQNTSLDSILELKYNILLNANSRFLINFNHQNLLNLIPSGTTANYKLQLFSDELHEIKLNTDFKVYPLSQDWVQGTGKFNDDPITTDGVCWSNTGNTIWIDSGSNFVTQSHINSGGGSWNSNYVASQSLEYNPLTDNSDLYFNVNDIVGQWISGTIDNFGFIVKLDKEQDLDINSNFQYFSADSSTIYSPQLIATWDDSSFITGSLNALSGDIKTIIYYKNLNMNYTRNSTVKIELGARNKYTQATFNYNNHPLNQNLYLPETSYYSIIDENTNEVVIDYGDYTKISCNSDGNYFWLDMSNFNIDRIYRIAIKSVFSDETVKIFNNQDFFRIES